MKTKDEIHLSKNLIARQKLTELDVDAIKELHLELQSFFDDVRTLDPTTLTTVEASDIVMNIERLENAMQKSWKFTPNSDMHSWWYQTPHCNCPVMDNQDMMGLNYRYINSTCPLHNNISITSRWDVSTKLELI